MRIKTYFHRKFKVLQNSKYLGGSEEGDFCEIKVNLFQRANFRATKTAQKSLSQRNKKIKWKNKNKIKEIKKGKREKISLI